MLSIPPEAAVRAFDTLAAMRRCATPDELNRAMGEALERLDLPWFSLARFFARDGRPAVAVLHGRFEPGWSERYVQQNYAASSLIARELLTRSDSYSWSEILARSNDPVQDRIFCEAREHGLRDGLFTPVRWSDGSYAAVVTAGRHAQLGDPVFRTLIEVLSTYYAHECRRLGVAPPAAGAILSVRQRDCLAWVRHGKSSTDIAELLGISAATVEEHVAAACRRLGVRTRVQAAVEASLLGII
jgi:DNA-binding CsgD family transcriptional regulator